MTPIESVEICFSKIFDYKSRANRSEFWWLYLVVSFLGLIVQINSGISLQNIPAPIPRNYSTQVYSTSTTGGGGTGLFYVNTNNTDELVSRKRAIIYGIIF